MLQPSPELLSTDKQSTCRKSTFPVREQVPTNNKNTIFNLSRFSEEIEEQLKGSRLNETPVVPFLPLVVASTAL